MLRVITADDASNQPLGTQLGDASAMDRHPKEGGSPTEGQTRAGGRGPSILRRYSVNVAEIRIELLHPTRLKQPLWVSSPLSGGCLGGRFGNVLSGVNLMLTTRRLPRDTDDQRDYDELAGETVSDEQFACCGREEQRGVKDSEKEVV
jgi:hypothetical protein